jgi:antitoxin HicB
MKMQTFVYPIALETPVDGGFVVSCRDLPEVITDADTRDGAIEAAEGALQAALEFRIRENEVIPQATKAKRGEVLVAVPIGTAMKAALYLTMNEQGINKSELARRLGVDEKEARRMLDPKHSTKVPALERALHILGKRTELRIA